MTKTEPTLDAEFINMGDYEIRVSGFGHSILIIPGATMRIPKSLHGDVVRQGAVPLDPDAVKLEADRPEDVAHKQANLKERNLTIKDVIRAMVAENKGADWGANGRPKMAVVSEKIGHKVTVAEITEAWSAIRPETV